ncbi:hypothetical protein GW915_08835 [bacterium]|nr:hypothetical protein [bacterium]
MKKFSLIMAVPLFLFCFSSFAQRSAFLYSEKAWIANRWFVIGQISDRQIKWWGNGRSPGVSLNPSCKFSTEGFTYDRLSDEDDFEILQGSSFILIEVDPLENREEITLRSDSKDNCEVKFSLEYAFGESAALHKPYLFLKAQNTRYNGYEFVIYTPPSSGRSDIQMDIMLGFWSVGVNRAAEGAKSSLFMAPAALARGEWKPDFVNKGLGFSLQLEQTLAVLGAVKNQSLYFSDIVGGVFVEDKFSVAEGLLLRFSGKLYQHQADDGGKVSTVDDDTEFMFLPVISVSSSLYFGSRYLLGLGIDYGLPNEIVSSTGGQSMMGGYTRLGVRLTAETFWLFEGVYRSFFTDSGARDNIIQFNTGVRLEL